MTAATVWGDVIVTAADNRPRIDKADKYVKISDQFIAEARSDKSPWLTVIGDRLLLHGCNRQVAYRLLGTLLSEPGMHTAERIDD